MPKKQLIVANDVRQAAKSGDHFILLLDKTAIVTSEARGLAKDLGVDLKVAEPAPQPEPSTGSGELGGAEEAALRRAVALHAGAQASEAVMEEVVRRVALERAKQDDPTIRKVASIAAGAAGQASGGLSNPVQQPGAGISQFDLATIVGQGVPPRAVGFMGWSRSFFPFTREGDEINVVLQGELQFRIGQALISAREGDVMLIPKGTKAEIGTPSSVRLFYASYPG